MCRELTRDERKGIRKLVTEMCANYDREYGCLPLAGECYMLGKCWTGAAILLLRSLQGRGKTQKEPGSHEEKA